MAIGISLGARTQASCAKEGPAHFAAARGKSGVVPKNAILFLGCTRRSRRMLCLVFGLAFAFSQQPMAGVASFLPLLSLLVEANCHCGSPIAGVSANCQLP